MAHSNKPGLERFLARLTSRSVLTHEEQQAILDLPARSELVEANRDFVPLGAKVDHACLIVDGIVGRFDQNWDGKRQITALHIPGDMADVLSVVQPTSGSALQALSIATILRVPHTAIPALAQCVFPSGMRWSQRESSTPDTCRRTSGPINV